MKKTIFWFGLILSQNGYSSVCLNYNKNCQAISAKKMYLGSVPVCVMMADCDVYCGSEIFDRRPTTLYCGFKKDNICMSAEECNEDQTVIKSPRDISKLSYVPTKMSAGSGLVIPPADKGSR